MLMCDTSAHYIFKLLQASDKKNYVGISRQPSVRKLKRG